mmetsp:Transcript_22326/g.53103  ORF Transcript_22326/g.53103 Transcript_22326/m.53103 type:complete len:325 (+) Transcript_22326:142-1116(+)|eukprot:CAMPEP_0197188488 /NCGR_PEP_ID=MMETSP1423-20130617/17876_1 /TAXON_ID=476441 /ORGANISM="Pseudo-nitzschia heimii, Strain UNC1101" /LENGTH=324 /DNA_ID=CAMNT_0042640329 /DNA_START=89 /DNA_END=1063 /DNA_ORIENTATION=+
MVFGRKKNQDENAVDADKDLEFGDGIEVQPVNDDLSLTDSIPPPPPDGEMVQAKNEEDSKTLEEYPSTGPNDDANGSLEGKEYAESIKRKKLMLIAGCIVSFFILLGLAISYGKRRTQSRNNASAAAGLEDGALDSPITEIPVTDSPFLISTEPPTIPSPPLPDTDNVFVPETDPTVTVAGNEETASIGVDQGTSAPSSGTSSSGTSLGSMPGNMLDNMPGFEECIANDITVLTSCNINGAASASMSFCLVDAITDQFWEFVYTPPQIELAIANDWGWMRDGSAKELAFLPEGTYEVGLFSNGNQAAATYPLITSREFVVNCDV